MLRPKITLLISISLRAVTLGSRFLLVFFLAHYLVPAELGLYGLLVATIGYALYLLGMDFYTFTTRELIKSSREDWGGLLKSHGALALMLYFIFLPLLVCIFWSDTLPWWLAGWFFVLVILEHLNQEFMRLLIAVSEPLMANVMLFLRQGAWAVLITGIMYLHPEYRTLQAVLLAWSVGGGTALLLALYKLHHLQIQGWSQKVDWYWISQGLKVALPLLVSTLALRGLFTIDRYWLEALGGLDVLGAYVLFMGFSNSLMAFLDAGVFAFIYPKLISSFQKKNASDYRKGVKKLAVQTIALSVLFVVAALLLIGPLLKFLDKPLYIEQQAMFPWILLGMVSYALGMIPHYALYAQGLDRPIIRSHIAGLIVFVLATLMLSSFWPAFAVPMGVAIGLICILIWKIVEYTRLSPKQYLIY
ncbi:hypothetical protein [Pseudomonas sp. MS19]|uniref:lipopolysaccharide biosynthesis protein n=1 Tax=Pseudomonas sp. MS19 TaxID=2579939 RepID=UPI0015620470|nr:hypothetical protein [Pseudomonas sp. MS19]NRH26807.1 hypothetical protein [Pseudomonas sp. MS19]